MCRISRRRNWLILPCLYREALDGGQDGILHAPKRLRDQSRADCACGLSRTQSNHAAAPTRRHRRCRQQVAGEIEDVAHVVLRAEARQHEAQDIFPIGIGEPDRPTDARMEALVLRQRHRRASVDRSDLDEHARLAVGVRLQHLPHVEGSMGPRRLRQVLDGGREFAATCYEQHVCRTQRASKRRWIGGDKRLFAGNFAPQTLCQPSAKPIESCRRRSSPAAPGRRQAA